MIDVAEVEAMSDAPTERGVIVIQEGKSLVSARIENATEKAETEAKGPREETENAIMAVMMSTVTIGVIATEILTVMTESVGSVVVNVTTVTMR